jgi:hypothetical protein
MVGQQIVDSWSRFLRRAPACRTEAGGLASGINILHDGGNLVRFGASCGPFAQCWVRMRVAGQRATSNENRSSFSRYPTRTLEGVERHDRRMIQGLPLLPSVTWVAQQRVRCEMNAESPVGSAIIRTSLLILREIWACTCAAMIRCRASEHVGIVWREIICVFTIFARANFLVFSCGRILSFRTHRYQ